MPYVDITVVMMMVVVPCGSFHGRIFRRIRGDRVSEVGQKTSHSNYVNETYLHLIKIASSGQLQIDDLGLHMELLVFG